MSLPRGPQRGRRQRKLGQSFIRDPNLLELIVREAGVGGSDVVLEVGAGGGALTEVLAPRVSWLHAVEVDTSLRGVLEPLAGRLGNVELHWGDALRIDLAALHPPPGVVIANLPYAIATPLLVETTAIAGIDRWLVMVQREIADRLRAEPGSRTYGAATAQVRLSCDVELVRTVGRQVFSPPPRVDSALLRMRRHGPPPPAAVRALVRDAFAHRRKPLPRSLDLARPGLLEPAREALAALGLPPDARAEALEPGELRAVAERLG